MTRRGWSVLGAGFGLWVVGRMLGIGELFQLALVLVMLCLLSLVHVSWGRHHLQVERHLPAVRVHRGSYLGLELSVTNPHRLRTPLVTLIEDLPPPLGTHKFSVTVEPRRQRLISYGLWPDRRGLYTLPPTRTLVGDPFGLARRTGSHGSSSTLIVYPRVEELASPEGSSARLTRGTRSRHLPAAGGEDFYGIRDYVPGDDRRKVHWRSTARTGRLMVREDETTGLPRLAVFVDDRESSHLHSGDSFEWVVEAAASIVSLYSKKQYAIRLVRTTGESVPLGRGAAQFHRILEALALASTRPGSDAKFRSLRHAGHEGVLVAVMGRMSPADARVLAGASRGFEEVVALVAPAVDPDDEAVSFLRTAVKVIHPRHEETLSDAWARSTWGTARTEWPAI